jgi:hypothetical protein
MQRMTHPLGGRLTAVLALVAALVCDASGQGALPAASRYLATCGHDAPGLGRIRGQLVADSAGLDITRQAVIAIKGCLVLSDSVGGFTMRGLPAGTYGVLAAPSAGHGLLPATQVRVTADSTATVTVHLTPPDRLADCRRFAECAAILASPPRALLAALSDSDQVREAGFRTVLALSALPGIAADLSTPKGYHLATWSLEPVGAPVVAAVRARVPTAEANHPRNTPGAGGLTPDQERFHLVRLRSVSIDGDHATVSGATDTTPWVVTLERTPSGWRPVVVQVGRGS